MKTDSLLFFSRSEKDQMNTFLHTLPIELSQLLVDKLIEVYIEPHVHGLYELHIKYLNCSQTSILDFKNDYRYLTQFLNEIKADPTKSYQHEDYDIPMFYDNGIITLGRGAPVKYDARTSQKILDVLNSFIASCNTNVQL